MTLKDKINFILVILVGLVFLSYIHSVLSPFIIAVIIAYLLNPLVKLIINKFRFPRILAVAIVYVLILGIIIFISVNLGILLKKEVMNLAEELRQSRTVYENNINTFPVWSQPIIAEIFNTVEIENLLSVSRIWPYFSGAISSIGSVFIFLFAAFYLLKDGHIFYKKFINLATQGIKNNAPELQKRINAVFNNYLRGQIFLVFVMSGLSWLVLSILKVKYALTLGIFTGVVEIIPIIGPITAGAVACLVAMFDGLNVYSISPITEGLIVAGAYFFLRQMEDIFIMPYVMGKATKLHPLAILCAVLIGGRIWGILGMIIAAPFVALILALINYWNEYYLEK